MRYIIFIWLIDKVQKQNEKTTNEKILHNIMTQRYLNKFYGKIIEKIINTDIFQ